MNRTVSLVADRTVVLFYRGVNLPTGLYFSPQCHVAGKTELTLVFPEIVLIIPGMGVMTSPAVIAGERRMGAKILRLGLDVLMTGQTDTPPISVFHQQVFPASLMGIMTTAALSPGERGMEAEAPRVPGYLLMTAQAELCLFGGQQILLPGSVRLVTLQTCTFRCRGMGHSPLRILSAFMATVAESSPFAV